MVLAADIFEHVLSLKLAQRPASVGVIANQLRDFDSVREFFTSGTVVSVTDLLFAIVFLSVLLVIAGPLAYVPMAMLPIMILFGLALQRPLDRAMRRLQGEAAARHGVLVESLSGIEAVRAVGGEARMQTAWKRSVAATARSGEDVHFWSSLALTASSTAQQLTSFLIVVIGVFLILDGKLSVGALVAANMLAGRVLAPIVGIAAVITRGTQTFSALKAIDRVDGARARAAARARLCLAPDRRRRLRVRQRLVPLSPAPRRTRSSRSRSRSVPGERVGVIGRIGSGKTTIGKLLAGFYEPSERRHPRRRRRHPPI